MEPVPVIVMTGTTVIAELALPVLKAVEPPLIEASAVVPAVPLVPSQA